MDNKEWKREMQGLSAIVMRAIQRAPLTREAACLAALIGVLSVIRVDGLNEGTLLKEAQKAVPHRLPGEMN